MKSYILKYGLFGGIILLVFGLLMVTLMKNLEFRTMEFIGYFVMVISLMAIYLGVKAYRDKELYGWISFKDAFITGILISLIISAFYVIGWMVSYDPTDTTFVDQMKANQIEFLESEGKSAEEITIENNKFDEMMTYYNNSVVIRIFVTLFEIFPIALLVTFLSSLILKKKPPFEVVSEQ